MRHDPTIASEATVRRLAEAYYRCRHLVGTDNRRTLDDAYLQYLEECTVKLRTTAEVNREMVAAVRDETLVWSDTMSVLRRLLEEETDDF